MSDYQQLDSARSYHLYRYLIGRLAISRSDKGEPNNQQTAKRVGEKDLRKIISAVLADQPTWDSTVSLKSQNARLTTGRVANMLGKLQESLNRDYKDYEVPYSRVLTTEDVLVALYHLTELAPEERSQLGLPVGDQLTLLKQTLLSLQVQNGSGNYEAVTKAYKEAVGLDFAGSSATALNNLDEVNALIENAVREALSYLPDRADRFVNQEKLLGNEETIMELSRKAQREVRRLLVRSGNTQVFLLSNTTNHPFISHYLPPAFVKKLSKTVVRNERLTAQLPVYLKHITTEERGPLPFFDNSLGAYRYGNSYPNLLNLELQELDGQVEHLLTGAIPSPSDYELASQDVTKLTLSFYIKVDANYSSVSPDTFEKIASDNTAKDRPYQRVDFEYSSTGIGGTLSHLVKVINTTLLKDIPCLARFFPIAHDVTSTQTIIRDNVSSPIWAHSLVKLCHNQSVGDALWAYKDENSSYDDFSFGDTIGHGDFCGFDFLIAQAQSAVQARLQAILNTGSDPQQYLQELCEKVERQLTLKHAWQTLKYYPFSSMAMIATIREKILKGEFAERSLCETDTNIYFDAYLSIAEALLDEGAYRAAYPNLQKVSILETIASRSLALQGSADIDRSSCEVFSSQLIVRYLLCKSIYYYLYDLESPIAEHIREEFSSEVTRKQLVEKSWNLLALAQAHVKARLKKYLVVGEVSQGTFTPHYKLLSRIFLMRARLLTFFPRMVPKSEELLPTENFSGQQRTEGSIHWGKLYLLEKARLYIAAEGDGELYAYYAALQSCYYLTAAYAAPKDLTITNTKTNVQRSLNGEDCMMWAKRLRDHALLAYARTGRHCYNAIKEKSGLPEEYEPYGNYQIQKLPAIFEDRSLQAHRALGESDEFLTLDIFLLAINQNDLPKLTPNPPSKSIYLFGTNACHIFLARGLYMLCSNANQEFKEDPPDTPINWRQKLQLAARLFDMAWAVAEDGCSLDRDPDNREKRKVTRSFKGSKPETQYTTREIDSVRDLYPRRISEVADTGKLYSVACKVLLLHLMPEAERATVIEDIDKLFTMLHGQYRLKTKRFLQVLIRRQHRYNGHLEHFLVNARQVLESHMPVSALPIDDEEMDSIRNQLVKDLFATLLE